MTVREHTASSLDEGGREAELHLEKYRSELAGVHCVYERGRETETERDRERQLDTKMEKW